ncbi:hypothetical protein [Mycobacteroides abscessus]|uniref:hypothetical protein n=1 Tax=Mycobacteroides abscessus TaxID=36809 RepID=UPI000E67A9ED|nr:hypothetical protein [Mycobacteroides abscessus]RIR97828.1 hypothetical protein D2E45_24000 [Mycobacteroides abscessus]
MEAIGVWVGVISAIIALIALIASYLWYRGNRKLTKESIAVGERSRVSGINSSRGDSRELGFQNMIAAIDTMQYYLCRQNSGGSANRLSDEEYAEMSHKLKRRMELGRQLLLANVSDYDVVDPTLEHIEQLYFTRKVHMIDAPTREQYELCRSMLIECQRLCDELETDSSAQKKAAAIQQQKDMLNSGIVSKLSGRLIASDGVIIIPGAGDGAMDFIKHEIAAQEEMESYQKVCEERLKAWEHRGI